jgi:uncharacterized protein YutE (UPF0331/DUF86 family)
MKEHENMNPLDKDVVYRRVGHLERILQHLERNSQTGLDDYLKNEDLQAAVERRLQVAAQICIDISNYLIARLRLELPDEEENIFTNLAKANIISVALAKKMRSLIGFRNILVHEYIGVDSELVHHNLKQNLSDFREFIAAVTKYIEL